MDAAYLIAPVVGMFSALHCVGMCGGIAGALIFSLPRQVRENPLHLLWFGLAYNAGRILSYALAGALLGWFGSLLMAAGTGAVLAWGVRTAAAVATIGVGFYIAGWFPRFARLERLGQPLWRRLEPIGRRLLPVRTPLRAFCYGAVWGWLPCGLVYAMLIAAPVTAGAAGGAVYMALFGLGTLPAVLATGLLAGRLRGLTRHPTARLAGGMGVAGLGLFGFLSQSL